MKRTDLLGLDECLERAALKSDAKDGLFGVVSVGDVGCCEFLDGVGELNWLARSLYCDFMRSYWSRSDLTKVSSLEIAGRGR